MGFIFKQLIAVCYTFISDKYIHDHIVDSMVNTHSLQCSAY